MKLKLLENILILVLTILVCECAEAADNDYCFGKDAERAQLRHFTSKTAYQLAKSNNIAEQSILPGCQAQKIWILHRHGTRLPSEKTIKAAPKLQQLSEQIVAQHRMRKAQRAVNELCDEDLLALQFWKWNDSIIPEQNNYLVSQGYADLRGTAQTYQQYFGNLLPPEYNSVEYLFRHTNTQRTNESFKAFAEGLFGVNNLAKPEQIPEQDLLLRPYDYCDAWNNKNDKVETDKFHQLPIWQQTMANISRRLGFDETLPEEDITLMYDICRYEQAWQLDRVSAWCVAFLPEHVSVFELEDDLKYYYKSGYGYLEQNQWLTCHAVKDMLEHLNSTEQPQAIAYFAHSAAVQTFITALGINRDERDLTANNYTRLNDRRWQTSRIDPFAANFVAVKYECAEASTTVDDKHKVRFFLNQDAVELDWCDKGVCNWSETLKRYAHIQNADCDKSYCRSGAATMSISLMLSLLCSALLYHFMN